MRETAVRLHSFLVMDAKARERELNRMARLGWALTRIYGNLFARFTRTERTDLAYFVDWTDPNRPDGADYCRLLDDAGWEPVQELGHECIYASRPGTRPVPIQTDPALEYQRFRKKVLRRMVLAALPFLLLLLLFLLIALLRPEQMPRFFLDLLGESNMIDLLLVCAPVALPACAAYLVNAALRLRTWRGAVEAGEALPAPTRRAVRLGSLLRVLTSLLWVLLVPALIADMLLNGLFSLFNIICIILICLFGVIRRCDEPRIRKQIPAFLVFSVCAILLTLAGPPLRTVFPGRIPAAPVLVEGGGDVRDQKRTDTFLGSQAHWHEVLPEDTDIYTASLRVSARAWALPSLAGLDRQPIPENYRPVEGFEGIWQFTEHPTADMRRWHVLLRRDNLEVRLWYYGEEPAFDLVSLALAWAES